HEFRTPLSLIIGPLSDLEARRDGGLDPDLRQTVEVALRNARRLGHLTEQLLDLARLESGALRLDRVPVDLAALLRELTDAFRLGAARDGVRVEATLPDEPTIVLGDAERLETIFANLLSNAVRFTPAGGSVRVDLAAGREMVVRVSDDGPGIAPDQAERIFDRFYQTELGLDSGGGTGIGLALVRELAQLQGGSVALVSGPGEGAVFRVAL